MNEVLPYKQVFQVSLEITVARSVNVFSNDDNIVSHIDLSYWVGGMWKLDMLDV